MNLIDILILVAVASAVALAVFSLRKRKKSGKNCCGTCEGCGFQGSCHSRHT